MIARFRSDGDEADDCSTGRLKALLLTPCALECRMGDADGEDSKDAAAMEGELGIWDLSGSMLFTAMFDRSSSSRNPSR